MKKYDLYLTGTVGWSISADYVKYVLDKSKGKPVNVAVCSHGGYVDTGLEIYELFKNHGEVSVDFIGMSASAATFMAMGAKHVSMAKNALVLIHNSMSYVDEWGSRNKEQIDAIIERLKFTRDQLSTIDDVLAQIYSDRNGKSVDEVKAKMKKAAWIKASEAKDFGIVDDIIDAVKVQDQMPAGIQHSYCTQMGLPQLPKGFSPETGGDCPATSTIQKAMDLLKGLLPKPVAEKNQQEMKIKIFATVMALLACTEGFETDEKGNVLMSQEDMKKLDEELKAQNEACKQAKDLIEKLKGEIKSKDDEIANLKKGPGESEKGGEEVKEENSINGAAELFESIKDAL